MHEIDTTIDGVGDIVVCQPQKGFRFSTDALLLFLSLQDKNYSKILEIGSGCGIVSFLCSQRYQTSHVVAVELQDSMYSCLSAGIVQNGFETRITPLHADIGGVDLSEYTPFDLIVCNPPYRAAGSGQKSPYPVKNQAIYDDSLPPEKLFKAIKRNTSLSSDIAVCYTHDRHTAYVYAALAYDIYPQAMLSYIQGSGAMITVTLFTRIRHELPEHRFIVENSWKPKIDMLYKRG